MTRLPDYSAHAGFIAPAQATKQVWRVVVGFIAAGFLYILLNQLLFQSVYRVMGDSNAVAFMNELLSGKTPFAMYMVLGSFGMMILGLAVPLKLLHQRGVSSLIGPSAVAWGQFKMVLAILVVLQVVVAILPPWDFGGKLVRNMDIGPWLMLLPFSLLAVLIQVSAEEIVFRGYLQQQLAARFRSPLVWMVIPSVLFALGHYQPEAMGENALIITVWAGIFGMLMADLTARAGSLGPAIALHFVNNVFAILIVSLPDELSGLSLFLTPFSMNDTAALRAWLPVDFLLMFVMWLAARLAIRR